MEKPLGPIHVAVAIHALAARIYPKGRTSPLSPIPDLFLL